MVGRLVHLHVRCGAETPDGGGDCERVFEETMISDFYPLLYPVYSTTCPLGTV